MARIVNGKIEWFPDIDNWRLGLEGITREDIIGDLEALAAETRLRLSK